MRIISITLLLLLTAFSISNCAASEFLTLNTAEPENIEFELPAELLDQLSVENVNVFIDKANSELTDTKAIPQLTIGVLKDIAANGLDFNWQSLTSWLLNYLFKEIVLNVHLMGKLLFLAVLCSLLKNLQNSFAESSISLIAYSVCFIFLAVIVLNAFYQGIALASGAISSMAGFMAAMLPLMLTLLAGVGAVTSAALFTPIMLLTVNVVSVIVKDVVLSLLFLTAILQCVNYLSEKYKLSNLAGLLKQAALVILGFTMVIFVGITSIQGVAGGVADGLALRTAKFATSTFIPVFGKMFADTVELVMGASLLLKNVLGIFGVLVIALLCAVPLVKLVALIVVIKIAGALIQPMGDEKMAKYLEAVSNNLLLVFGALLVVTLMFFLTITMIMGFGNMALMLK